MADRYWVGGTDLWNATAGSKWATTSGGVGGASVPTSSDNVFIDANSGAVTVTIGGVQTSVCNDLNFTGFTGTLNGGGGSAIDIHGSLTVASGMTWSFTNTTTFRSTASGKTVTSNGKTLAGFFTFNGVGGVWTLQDAFNMGSVAGLTLLSGSLDTNGQTVTAGTLSSTGSVARTLTLGASTVNLGNNGAAITFSGTNFTFNAGTSTINLTGQSPVLTGGAKTFNHVHYTACAGIFNLNDANTFNNLTFTPQVGGVYTVNVAANQVITGTLTASSYLPTLRSYIKSATSNVTRTITAAAVSLTEIDFTDIAGAGAAIPFTGTRLGDCKGNSNITFDAPTNKYYVGNTSSWNGLVWALTSGGTPATANFPLAQDTAIFDANSFSANDQTVTFSPSPLRVGSIDFQSSITETGIVLNFNSQVTFFGDFTLKAGMSMITGGAAFFMGRNTQTISSGGVAWTAALTIDSVGGTVVLGQPLTLNSTLACTLTNGTLNLNGHAVSVGIFSSSNSNPRAITSGGATLTLTGNGTTIWSGATATNLTLNDALQVNATYSGSTGTRTFSVGSSAASGTESNSPSIAISAGTDNVMFVSGTRIKNLDMSGWASGTFTPNIWHLFGSLTLPSAAYTHTSGTSTLTFAATSGTHAITSNGNTIDHPVTFGFTAPGGTWQLADDLTIGSSRATTLTTGTIDLNGRTLSTGTFSCSGSSVREIKSSTVGGKIVTTSTSATTVFNATTATNLTITRNSWAIEIAGNTTNARICHLGASKTWPSLSFTNTTPAARLDIVSSGDATVLKSLSVSTPPQTIIRSPSTTITIEDDAGFPSGTTGNLVTIGSSLASNHTWNKSGGGVIDSDFLSISRSTATPGTTWYAGLNSTDGGNNSGWLFFEAPPTLVVAEASHAHVSDNLALTQQHVLTIATASQAHLTDNLVLIQQHQLIMADADHAQTAGQLTLFVPLIWDTERSKSGKHPFQWIEFEVDRCIHTYGTAPCAAAIGVTGAFKCVNGWQTCQDKENFSSEPYWIRICEAISAVPIEFDFSDPGVPFFLPLLRDVRHEPGVPNPGESLGSRTKITAEFVDSPHHDIGIDKYISERSYDAMEQGTFLRKIKARFPFFIGRRFRWYQGYLDQQGPTSISAFRKREYIMESWPGPNSTGKSSIIAKDVLKLLDDERAQAPKKSKGELAVALDATTSHTQIDITTPDDTEYDLKAGESIDYVRIGQEVFKYTGTTDISGGVRLTGVTIGAPAPYVTTRSSHAIGDAVQRCRYFQGTIPAVVEELMTDYGDMDPTFIPSAEWADEAEIWLAGDDVARLVTEPEGVKSLIDEIISQTLTWAFWHDEIDQEIKFRAMHPPDVGEPVLALTDQANLVADSIQITDTVDKVINEVQVLYAQLDPTKNKDEISNYRKGLAVLDGDSQGTNELGQRRIKRIFARWHPDTNSAVVLRHATRTLKSRVRNLVTVQFKLERKDENVRTAQFADLTTLYIIDEFGVPRTMRVQILRSDASGEAMTFQAREDFFKGAFSRWAPGALSGLLYDDATADQKALYIFWADEADGKLGTASDDGKTWS